MELARIIISLSLIFSGIFVLAVATMGLFKLNYVLNRMHAAAKCDTFATMLILTGVALLWGKDIQSFKLLFLIIFIWLINPVAVHIISRVEVQTNEDIEKECEVNKL